jgi:hypothetical protein
MKQDTLPQHRITRMRSNQKNRLKLAVALPSGDGSETIQCDVMVSGQFADMNPVTAGSLVAAAVAQSLRSFFPPARCCCLHLR